MTEQELIRAINKGDQHAFQLLISKYQDQIFRVSLGFLHNKEDAEEIAQDVFIEVYHSIHKFREESKLATWLYRIAVNKSLNFLRKKKKHSILKSIDSFFINSDKPEFEIEDVSQRHPLEIMEYREDAQRLYTVINSLPKNQRIAFTLNKYEDLAYKEIAEVMGLSLSGVESLIYRAKINLQKKLVSNKT